MSEIKIKRRQRNVSITLSTSTSLATTLRLDDMAGAVLSMGTVSTNASTLHIYAADAEAGSYRQSVRQRGFDSRHYARGFEHRRPRIQLPRCGLCRTVVQGR
jgi:hypothetical protein